MTKRYCIFITALFCAFLGLFLAANTLSPDRDFSAGEPRPAAAARALGQDAGQRSIHVRL